MECFNKQYLYFDSEEELLGLSAFPLILSDTLIIYIHRVLGDGALNWLREYSAEEVIAEKQRIKALLSLNDDDFVNFEDIFRVNIETNEFEKYLVGGSYRGFVVGVSATFLNSFVPYTKFPTMDSRLEDGTRKKWKEFLVSGQNQQGKNYIELVELSKNSCNLQDFKVLYEYMTSLNVTVLTLEEALV